MSPFVVALLVAAALVVAHGPRALPRGAALLAGDVPRAGRLGASGPARRGAAPGRRRRGEVREAAVSGSGPSQDRTGPPARSVTDPGVVLELLAVACGTTALPGALREVGGVVGGAVGRGLGAAGAALVLGADWAEAWEGARGADDGRASDGRAAAALLGVVEECLRPAWEQGAAPGPALRAARDRHGREADARALEAAERLGVRVVVPLGLCLLPAFVLLGLVPAVLALGTGLLGG